MSRLVRIVDTSAFDGAEFVIHDDSQAFVEIPELHTSCDRDDHPVGHRYRIDDDPHVDHRGQRVWSARPA